MCTWPKTIDMKRNSPAEIRRYCILNTLPPLPKNMELQPQALTYIQYIFRRQLLANSLRLFAPVSLFQDGILKWFAS